MVIKLYISGISGNKEVKKKQQRVQMILDSKQISYEAIDITEPGREKDKEFMQQNGKVREELGKHPLPPQIFNEDDFCGDYEDFDMANEVDELEKFLHIEVKDSENGVKQNEESRSVKSQSSNNSVYDPYNYHTVKIKWDSVNGVQEQIITNNELMEENKENMETTENKVNGESETSLSSQPPSETNLNTEASFEKIPAPEKEEELVTEQNNAEEEKGNNEDVEAEEEGTKMVEDNPNLEEANKEEEEEESPRAEEEEMKEEESEKEEVEKEGDNESGRESPQSEKSEDD